MSTSLCPGLFIVSVSTQIRRKIIWLMILVYILVILVLIFSGF